MPAGGEFGGCAGVRRAVPERAGPLGGAEVVGARVRGHAGASLGPGSAL